MRRTDKPLTAKIPAISNHREPTPASSTLPHQAGKFRQQTRNLPHKREEQHE
jgi:hypothetical protein